MVHRNQVIACVIRQYGSGLFKSCISMDKDKSICLGTHQNEAAADEIIDRFWEALKNGLIKSPEDALALVNSTA